MHHPEISVHVLHIVRDGVAAVLHGMLDLVRSALDDVDGVELLELRREVTHRGGGPGG